MNMIAMAPSFDFHSFRSHSARSSSSALGDDVAVQLAFRQEAAHLGRDRGRVDAVVAGDEAGRDGWRRADQPGTGRKTGPGVAS
jgi:hypothetical protein